MYRCRGLVHCSSLGLEMRWWIAGLVGVCLVDCILSREPAALLVSGKVPIDIAVDLCFGMSQLPSSIPDSIKYGERVEYDSSHIPKLVICHWSGLD